MKNSSKTDILLINPWVYAPVTKLPPLGLISIASNLDILGYNVKIADMQVMKKEDVITAMKDLKSDGIVGYGGASEGRRYVFELSKIAKEMHPNCTVIYGGPHASFTYDITLKKIDSIDIMVIHEGEITAQELAAHILKNEGNLKQIRGIAYRDKGVVVKTSPRQRISNLDGLEYNYEKFGNVDLYPQDLEFGGGKALNFVSSRGCYIKCNFCAAALLWEYNITKHSSSRILDEIEKMFELRPDLNGIIFSDSLFTFNKKHVENVCKQIKKRKLDFLWCCAIRANSVDHDLLAMMQDAGCYFVSFGFESASPRILKDVIHKKASIKHSLRLFEIVNKIKLHLVMSVTWGHPTETLQEAMYTLNFIKKYLNENIHMNDPQPMRIYPGTDLEDYSLKNNLLPEGFDWCVDYDHDPGLKRSTPYVPILIQPQMGIMEFKILQAEFEKIANYAGSHANFKCVKK